MTVPLLFRLTIDQQVSNGRLLKQQNTAEHCTITEFSELLFFRFMMLLDNITITEVTQNRINAIAI